MNFAKESFRIFADTTKLYHDTDDVDARVANPYTEGTIEATLFAKNWIDAVQWHLEDIIRLSIPPLTEERRRSLVKQSKAEAETAKVSVRNARRDAIDGLKKAVKQGMSEDVEKDAENDVQKLHDKYLKKIDDLFAAKEKEILTV